MPSTLPDEFRPSVLVERIILGAIQADPVRLHGTIVAALKLHGADARRDVFEPSLTAARLHGARIAYTVAAAINSHVRVADRERCG